MVRDPTLLREFVRISRALQLNETAQRRFWDEIVRYIQRISFRLNNPASPSVADISTARRELHVPSLEQMARQVLREAHDQKQPVAAHASVVNLAIVAQSTGLRLKPGCGAQEARNTFLTLATELADAARHSDVTQARASAQRVQQYAMQVFLEPEVAAALAAPAGTVPRVLLEDADDLATAVRRIAHRISGEAPASPENTAWPAVVFGGEQVQHFRFIRPLREGGMGDVVLAWDEWLDRHVVLKHLRGPADTSGRLRLEREAWATARLPHPNILIIYALEYFGDDPVLVEEYVAGDDLDALAGTIATAETLRIAERIAAAVAFAHENGIIHRDLKPQNVRVRTNGSPVVLDFGLSKAFRTRPEDRTQIAITQQGWMGTPSYMAPEQRLGAEITPAADVFSFGVLLFQLLTGKLPYETTNPDNFFEAIVQGKIAPIERSDVPAGVERLIRSCLASSARERPPMDEVRERLEAALLPEAVELHESIEIPLPQVETGPPSPSAWADARRAQCRAQRHKGSFAFEFYAAMLGLPTLSHVDIEDRVKNLSRGSARIGQVLTTLEHLDRELAHTVVTEDEYAHWAVRTTGELFYTTEMRPTAARVIPVPAVLRELAGALGYTARLARALGAPSDTQIRVTAGLQNPSRRLIGAPDWSPQLTTQLEKLKPAPERTESAATIALSFLEDDIAAAVKVIFDPLSEAFPFKKVPPHYYQELGELSAA